MTFTLRLPFESPPNRSFEPGLFRVGGVDVELQFRDPFHVLVVKGLKSEEDARILLKRLVGALTWVAIDTGIGIRVNSEPQTVTLQDSPAPPDSIVAGAFGIGDEGKPAIYPDDRPVRFAFVYPMGIHQSGPVLWFAPRLEEGMGLGEIGKALTDPTLRLAVDVFVSSFFEDSPVASFLARITVLEVLKEQADHPSAVQALIDRFQREVAELLGSQEVDQGVVDSLRTSLKRLEKESIGRAIRKLILNALGPEAAKSATELYTIRSILIHQGTIAEEEITRRLPELTQLVKDLLRARLASAPEGKTTP